MPLTHGVDVIGVGGLLRGFANIGGNLPPMIGGMHRHVSKDLLDRAGPGLSLAVGVVDRSGQLVGTRGVWQKTR